MTHRMCGAAQQRLFWPEEGLKPIFSPRYDLGRAERNTKSEGRDAAPFLAHPSPKTRCKGLQTPDRTLPSLPFASGFLLSLPT